MKPVIVYTLTALFAFIFDKIYAVFSHGVSSKSMSSIWIWLLCAGAVFYLILYFIRIKIKRFQLNRFTANIYNSGMAVFASGMLLGGIFEIAGTGSDFVFYYKAAGIALLAIGVVSLIISQLRNLT